MGRKLLSVLIAIISLNVLPCSAAKAVNTDQVAIGGISAGAGKNYIKGIYGDPAAIIIRSGDETWLYGDTFHIDFINDIVTNVVTSGNNGLSTPAGVSVGMKKDKMSAMYGRPQSTDRYGNRAIYTYQVESGAQMLFVTRDGIISEIRINVTNKE